MFTAALAMPRPDPHAASPPSSPSRQLNAYASPSPIALIQIDPCALLTSDELKAVQSEALQRLAFRSRLCRILYRAVLLPLPTITNSVVVNVTTPKNAGIVKEFWRSTHAKPDAERNPKKRNGPKRCRVGEEHIGIQRNRRRPVVLKKDVVLRISVGGAIALKPSWKDQRRSRRKHSRALGFSTLRRERR